MDSATFHLWNRLPAVATFVTSATLSVFRNWTLFVKMVHLMLTCSSLAGHEVLCFAASDASGSDLAVDTHRQIAQKLDENLHSVGVVLPDGQLLTSFRRIHRPDFQIESRKSRCRP